MPGNLGNSPNSLNILMCFIFQLKETSILEIFQKYTQSPIRIKEIWGIVPMPGNLGNFPNSLENLMVISQMHSYS